MCQVVRGERKRRGEGREWCSAGAVSEVVWW